MNVNDEFFLAVKQLEKEKNIPADKLYETIANALVTAKKHDFGGRDDVVFCTIDPEKREIEVYAVKTVVSEIEDPITDILPEEAQKYLPGAEPGDQIRIPLEIADFGRIVAQKVKHVIRQGIREVEQTRQSAEFQDKNREIVSAVVQSIDPKTGNVSLEINGTESTLPKAEQIPGETFRVGETIKVFIFDVRSLDRGLRVLISRKHSGFVKRLFETEVPEIADGTVEIRAIAREAGLRTKVAVLSNDENVDPVGACIGQRGARIDNIRFILGGEEKIDVIPYSEDISKFIAAALAPAEVLKVEQDPADEIVYHVTVPDGQLSLAIGNKGLNAKLAAKLTGKKIDIDPESGFYDPEKAAEALS